MSGKGYRGLVLVTGGCSLLNGAGYLFFPKLTLGILGVVPGDFSLMITQYYGACAIGWGLLLLLAQKNDSRSIRKALLLSILVTLGPSALAGAFGVLKGLFNSYGWSLVVADTVLSLGSVYFLGKTWIDDTRE